MERLGGRADCHGLPVFLIFCKYFVFTFFCREISGFPQKIVSTFRAYSPTELEKLAADVGVPGYSWQAGRVPIGSVPGWLTYLLGYPPRCDT